MRHRRSVLLLSCGLALAAMGSGCAKRPAIIAITAPAPTGIAAPVAPPAVPAPVAPPAMPAPAQRPEAVAPTPGASVPPAIALARPKPEEFVVHPDVRDVHFDFDKSDIRPDAARILDADAAWLVEHPGYAVLVEGHCDERGTNAYNLALGDRRAQAAINHLVARGVARTRFVSISYGEERPVCTERAETCWSRNRRAHILVKPE